MALNALRTYNRKVSASNIFGALLRYWRNARGFSQLDLSATAEVSARHLSFLETGRARPSREMVMQLSAALDVPMREQNSLLRAAGFSDAYAEPELGEGLDPQLRGMLERMLAQQEPYPLIVMNSHYDVVQMNGAALRLFGHALGERAQGLAVRPNLPRLVFDPEGLRPLLVDWDSCARYMLLRLQREILQRPADLALKQLMSSMCGYAGVPANWRVPDLEQPSHATFNFQVELAGVRYAFSTALTVFNSPQSIAAEELRMESYFPLDDVTDALCRRLAESPSGAVSQV